MDDEGTPISGNPHMCIYVIYIYIIIYIYIYSYIYTHYPPCHFLGGVTQVHFVVYAALCLQNGRGTSSPAFHAKAKTDGDFMGDGKMAVG